MVSTKFRCTLKLKGLEKDPIVLEAPKLRTIINALDDYCDLTLNPVVSCDIQRIQMMKNG